MSAEGEWISLDNDDGHRPALQHLDSAAGLSLFDYLAQRVPHPVQIRAHIGNYSLFLTGIFPERIRVRAERRGFPDLKYFEAMGRSQYGAASDHRLAQRYELSEIFSTLSDRFEATRLKGVSPAEAYIFWKVDFGSTPSFHVNTQDCSLDFTAQGKLMTS